MPSHKAFRFRIYPDAEQESLFEQTDGCRRLVYNLCLEQRSTWGHQHRISSYDQINELPALKKDFPFLQVVPSQCLQQAILDLNTAFKNFFKGNANYPTYAKRSGTTSFRFPDPKQFFISKDCVFLPKVGYVEWVMHREIVGTPKNLTVIREGNWWFASITCEVDEEVVEPGSADFGERLGIDLGVTIPIMLSTGANVDIVRTPKRETRRQRKLQKQLARQKAGSRNRAKTVCRLRALHAHQARRRLNNAHKVSARIAREHSHVAMEDLRLLNMTASAKGTIEEPGKNVAQKAGLNRSILDLAHGQLRALIKAKVTAARGTFVLVDPRNTSRRCNPCGHVSAESRKSQAEFQCVSCGHKANADHNASINICEAAFGRLAGNPTGGHPGLACESNRVTGRKQEQTFLQALNP